MKEYYAQFSWFSMGRMTRSTFNDNKEQTDTLRRIGDVVATDAIPIESYGTSYDSVHLFIDSLSGYCRVLLDGCRQKRWQ